MKYTCIILRVKLLQVKYTCIILQVKCYQYYPTGEDSGGRNEMVFDDVGLRVTFVGNKESNYHYTARILKLEDLEVCRYFLEFFAEFALL